jgi:hypothetical protein
VIPADASCALLMDTSGSVVPATDLTGEIRSRALVELGARSRPDLDDIKRATSTLNAATKSDESDKVTTHTQQYLATSYASLEFLSRIVSDADDQPSDDLLDTVGRALAAAAQLISCPSLSVSIITLPRCVLIHTFSMKCQFCRCCPSSFISILRLLAFSRHFLASHAAVQVSTVCCAQPHFCSISVSNCRT